MANGHGNEAFIERLNTSLKEIEQGTPADG